ncbi:MAG: hypothetical protein M3P41_11945 [Actinomycetota bacterium]|nr:hypothetical protein [Actinomycetota bacterium]
MADSAFKRALVLLAALRIAPALIVLAENGHSLPALPGYGYGPPEGDTYGFYAAAREFISVWTRLSKPLLGFGVLLLAGAAAGAYLLWSNYRKGEAVTLAAAALGIFLSAGIHEMGLTGAGAVGWPVVWSLPLLPLRVVGALGYHGAYYLGIAILLLCNIVTIVATALIARRLVPGRLALLAPALLVIWPFLMRGLEGTGNVVYGSWLDDTGLLLYAEPLSTALVATALALLILRRSNTFAAALAGALLAFSVAVRVSNVTIVAVVFIALVFAGSRRATILFTLACAGAATVAAEFWSRGYGSFKNHPSDQAPNGLFSWHYLVRSWRDSGVFDWKMLLVLLPLPIIGVLALRRRRYELWLLAGVVIVTAVFYSAYYITALHPRFLFVALPPLFVLAAVGVERLVALRR